MLQCEANKKRNMTHMFTIKPRENDVKHNFEVLKNKKDKYLSVLNFIW